MKRILITGADGFIGSHLVEECLKFDYQVKAFVLYNSFNSWGWLDDLPDELLRQIEIYPGDIRDPYGVRKAVEDVDIIFHLAALIGIPFSYHSPDAYVDTNIKGTLNILQAGRDLGVQKIIITSTSEVYGTAEYVPIDEKHPLKAQSPYAATKIAADRLAESFHRSFDTPIVIARPFNTYGPRQSLRAVIPTIISQVLSGKQKITLGALHPTRDFNYVVDTCKGFLALAEADAAVGEEINIASGKEISIKGVVETIARLCDREVSVVEEIKRIRPERSEVDRLLGSHAKLKELTNWQPEYDFEKGLSHTIAWFNTTKHIDQKKVLRYNI